MFKQIIFLENASGSMHMCTMEYTAKDTSSQCQGRDKNDNQRQIDYINQLETRLMTTIKWSNEKYISCDIRNFHSPGKWW